MTYSTSTDQITDLLQTTGQLHRAKIAHDGSKVIFSNGHDLYMVDWTGSNNHLIMRNAAICCYWYNCFMQAKNVPAASKSHLVMVKGQPVLSGKAQNISTFRGQKPAARSW
jgi:hypothetical protein